MIQELPPARLEQKRHIVTSLPGPQSVELTQRRQQAISAGVGSVHASWVHDADGGIILDVDGNSLIDLGSGIAVTNIGASNSAVRTAVQQAAHRFTHTCFAVSAYEEYLQVCEELNTLTPGNFAKKSFLTNSGAEAVENAIKIARAAVGRSAVIALDHAFHGRTNLTMGLTAKAYPYKQNFGPFSSDIYRIPSSYPLRDGLTGEQAAARAITAAEQLVSTQDIAAIIAEPIQGEGGIIVPNTGFLHTIAQWAKSKGIVFIADEIQSGIARTGHWFACQYDEVEPDIITTAKGLANGLPLAGVTGRSELLDAVHPGGLGGTYTGNPLACVASKATFDFIKTYGINEHALRIEKKIHQVLGDITELEHVAQLRGRGAMYAVEFVQPGTLVPAPEITRQVVQQCHERGVVVLTAGTYGNVVRLLPPLVIDDELLEDGLTVLRDVITSLE